MAGTITSLQYQKRDPERVNVYVDGRFAFGLAAIVAARLKVGQVLSDEDVARLAGRDEAERAYERALSFLSYRPRSEAEVRRNLDRRGLPGSVVEEIVARLTRAGFLDDAAFARYWVDNRRQFRPRGAQALRHELRQKGVPEGIIAEALLDLDEESAARRVALEASHRYGRLPPREFARKMQAYLARRGFSYPVARPLIDELLDAMDDNELLSDELPDMGTGGQVRGGSMRGGVSDMESEESSDA